MQLQVRVVQLQREGGARLSYVCHQPQLSSTARRSCSAAAMLCCGRRKVSAVERTINNRGPRAPVTVNDGRPRRPSKGPQSERGSLYIGKSLPLSMRESRVRTESFIDRLEAPQRFFEPTQRKYRQVIAYKNFMRARSSLDLADKRDGFQPNRKLHRSPFPEIELSSESYV